MLASDRWYIYEYFEPVLSDKRRIRIGPKIRPVDERPSICNVCYALSEGLFFNRY